jgi:hypothetical protein
LSLGIFKIHNLLFSSSLTNTTFTNITHLYNGVTLGGAVGIYTPNVSSFAIDCCIFTCCKAREGGALFLSNTSCIIITRTRFENNSADLYGDDIGGNILPCFNKVLNGILSSSVCSTTPLGDRLNCYNYGNEGGSHDVSQLQNTCSKEVV